MASRAALRELSVLEEIPGDGARRTGLRQRRLPRRPRNLSLFPHQLPPRLRRRPLPTSRSSNSNSWKSLPPAQCPGRVALLYVGICWVILEPVHVVSLAHARGSGMDQPAGRRWHGARVSGRDPDRLDLRGHPEGLKPSTAVDPRHSLLQHTGRRLNRAILGVLGVMVAYFLVYHFWLGRYIAEPVKEEAHQGERHGWSRPPRSHCAPSPCCRSWT